MKKNLIRIGAELRSSNDSYQSLRTGRYFSLISLLERSISNRYISTNSISSSNILIILNTAIPHGRPYG